MPSRQILKTVETPAELMGDGAWVSYQEPTTEEMREFRQETARFQKRMEKKQAELLDSNGSDIVTKEFDELVEEAERFQANFLALYIREWNWVADAAGEVPLPQPGDNPHAFSNLRASELAWLGSLFNISVEKKRITR